MHSLWRLGILVTHPVQYYSALYRALSDTPGVELTVYYAHRPAPEEQGIGFGVPFQWDVDLLSGYRHVWLQNRSARPTAARFRGCDTPTIADVVRRSRFDAFLVMGWHTLSYWQAIRAAFSSGTPLLVRGDSQLGAETGTTKGAVKRLLYPRFVSRMAACLAVGTRSERYFRHYGARRVLRSPHFVDNTMLGTRADAGRRERPAVRASLGLPADATVVLFAGKLVPKKRPIDLVRAVARLGRARLLVLIAGDGQLREAVAEAARALRVDVRFAGFLNQTEIPRAYAAADMLVLPSDERETWGLVVNEAMASGIPVIVSDACGCAPDLVDSGTTGYTFPAGDIGRLSTVIATLADDPRTAQRVADAGRRHVAAFSVDAACEGVLTALAEASYRSPPARPVGPCAE